MNSQYGKFTNQVLLNMETEPQFLVLELLVCPGVKIHALEFNPRR